MKSPLVPLRGHRRPGVAALRIAFALFVGASCAAICGCASRDRGADPGTAGAPRELLDEAGTGPTVVTLDSPLFLVSFKILVRAGSADDPAGKEGLAYLTAQALLEGGFGDPSDPMTKERLAELTLPWGDGALPNAQVAAETTTFHFTVPRDVLATYVEKVLRPLLLEPLILEPEVERLRTEMASRIPMLRHESLENLGLAAIDAYVLEGTRYVHQAFGAEETIGELTPEDVRGFYDRHYRPGFCILGVSTGDPEVVGAIARVLRSLPAGSGAASQPPALEPREVRGRHAVVVEEPNAPAASIHLGFPIEVTRTHPDFWPLYVANTWLGVHRDSFSHLYRVIRQERGYNYGDYSYIEYWGGRPYSLFQTFNQPRSHQYFSIWIRPVGHEYAHHIAKAATFELARLVRDGLTEEQVAEAKTKARVLYLNLAENVDRLLAARLDDVFYGMSPGFLEGYLEKVDAVTPEDVNAAIRRHLQVEDLKYVIVTDSKHAPGLAEELERGGVAWGKGLADYQLEKETLEDGATVWKIPEERVETLRTDALWAHYPLRLESVRRVPVAELFRTGAFPAGGPVEE